MSRIIAEQIGKNLQKARERKGIPRPALNVHLSENTKFSLPSAGDFTRTLENGSLISRLGSANCLGPYERKISEYY